MILYKYDRSVGLFGEVLTFLYICPLSLWRHTHTHIHVTGEQCEPENTHVVSHVVFVCEARSQHDWVGGAQ